MIQQYFLQLLGPFLELGYTGSIPEEIVWVGAASKKKENCMLLGQNNKNIIPV
jgi:hypothetical protein